MRKFYSFIVTMILGVVGLSASAEAVNFTINVEDASAIKAEWQDPSDYSNNTIYLDNGANAVSLDGGYVQIFVNDDNNFVLRYEVKVAEGKYPYYYGNNSYLSFSVNEDWEGAVINISVASLAELRSAKFTLKCDDPKAITLYSSTGYSPELTNAEEQTIAFDPTAEKEWRFYKKNYVVCYKVELNGEEVPTVNEDSYNYEIEEMKDGDVLDIVTKFPDMPVAVKFVFDGDCKDAVNVLVNEVKAENYDADDFTVNMGDVINLKPNTNEFDNITYTVNDGYANNLYYPADIVVLKETTITITATKKQMYDVTFNIDDPEAVNIFVDTYSDDPADAVQDLVKGDNIIKLSNNVNVRIVANDGYVIDDVVGNPADASPSYKQPTEVSIYYSSNFGNCTYSVTTGKISEIFTGSFTLNLDGEFEQIGISVDGIVVNTKTLVQGENTLHFIPGKGKVELNLTPKPYMVTVDGAPQAGSYGGYQFTVSEGSVVEVKKTSGQTEALITIVCEDEIAEQLVTEVRWKPSQDSDEEYTVVENRQEPFALQVGALLVVEVDVYSDEIATKSITVNGAELDLEDFYGNIMEVVKGDMNIAIAGKRFEEIHYTINVDNAQAVTVVSEADGQIALIDGKNELTMMNGRFGTNITISPSAYDYEIISITDGKGNPIPDAGEEYSTPEEPVVFGYYEVILEEGTVINITAKAIEFENMGKLYVGPGVRGYVYFGKDGSIEMETSESGYYKDIKFNVDSCVVSIGGNDITNAYLDNVEIENESDYAEWGGFSAEISIKDGDVIKLYAEEPTKCIVTISDEANAIAEVLVDEITIEDAATFEVLSGTVIALTPAEGAKIESVKVGDDEVAAGQKGVYTIEATAADTQIVVTAVSGISSVAADKANGKVYNLQGIEMKGGKLLPGIYVIDGKKVSIRK